MFEGARQTCKQAGLGDGQERRAKRVAAHPLAASICEGAMLVVLFVLMVLEFVTKILEPGGLLFLCLRTGARFHSVKEIKVFEATLVCAHRCPQLQRPTNQSCRRARNLLCLARQPQTVSRDSVKGR